MLSKFAANSIMAKAHALYGRKLTSKNYSDLLACKSVGEAASYLKTRTAYAEVMENCAAASLHRTQLETILKQRVFNQCVSLCRYEMSIGQDFYKYFMIQGDIEQIITCLRLLSTSDPHDYLMIVPDFFNQHTEIDLYALASAKNMKGVLEALSGSPYKAVLEPYFTEDINNISITQIETALEEYMYSEIEKLIVSSFPKKTGEEIMDFFKTRADLLYIVRLYRIKSFYKNNDNIFWAMHAEHKYSLLSKKILEEMKNAKTCDELMSIVYKSSYGSDFRRFEFKYIEDCVHRVAFYRGLRNFRYSTNPYLIMLCYVYLAETELENVIHIIEGIRYNVPREEIASLLVGAD